MWTVHARTRPAACWLVHCSHTSCSRLYSFSSSGPECHHVGWHVPWHWPPCLAGSVTHGIVWHQLHHNSLTIHPVLLCVWVAEVCRVWLAFYRLLSVHLLHLLRPSSAVDIIWAMMIVWRIGGKILRSVLCCVCMLCTHIRAVLTGECCLRFRFSFCAFVFTVRCSYASAVLGVEILSVRPSVRLSVCHMRALWLIQQTYWWYFSTTWEGNPSSFLTPKISVKFQQGHPRRGRQIEVG